MPWLDRPAVSKENQAHVPCRDSGVDHGQKEKRQSALLNLTSVLLIRGLYCPTVEESNQTWLLETAVEASAVGCLNTTRRVRLCCFACHALGKPRVAVHHAGFGSPCGPNDYG